jgi:hypothetical protein
MPHTSSIALVVIDDVTCKGMDATGHDRWIAVDGRLLSRHCNQRVLVHRC